MTMLELRDTVILARRDHAIGLITTEQLYAKADTYIAALREYRRTSGKRFAIPTRGYLIRAL